MQTNQILQSALIDIIFDGRNKEYGAYELRRQYSKRIRNALLITGLMALIGIGSIVLANSSRRNPVISDDNGGVRLTEIEEKRVPEPLPEPQKLPEEVRVKTEIFTAPRILEDDQVITPPPAMADLDSAQIGVVKQEGVPDDGIQKLKEADGNKGILEVKHTDEPGAPLVTVDLDAKFTGNWKVFLERNLVAEVPVSNEAPPGRYPVLVKFVVDLEGHVSDIVAMTRHGYGMEEEAMRVIRKSARWEPAIFNGHPVKAYKKQLVTFVVDSEE